MSIFHELTKCFLSSWIFSWIPSIAGLIYHPITESSNCSCFDVCSIVALSGPWTVFWNQIKKTLCFFGFLMLLVFYFQFCDSEIKVLQVFCVLCNARPCASTLIHLISLNLSFFDCKSCKIRQRRAGFQRYQLRRDVMKLRKEKSLNSERLICEFWKRVAIPRADHIVFNWKQKKTTGFLVDLVLLLAWKNKNTFCSHLLCF